MRRALVASLLVVAACTSSRQIEGALRTASSTSTSTSTTQPLPSGLCAQWYETAIAVGWPAEQWPTVDRIMWAESRCNATAYNPIGSSTYGHARGLMQIMDELWPAHCGITADQLYDPQLNLACALHVWQQQGWEAWSTY